MATNNQRVFGILRFFSIASLASIFVAAVALALLYRAVAVREIVNLGEHGHQVMVDSFLDAVRPEIDDYLSNESAHHTKPMPKLLAQAIKRLMEDETIIQVTIMDDEGIIVFSSETALIGENRKDLPAFQRALRGETVSRLDFRDVLDLLRRHSAVDNAVRTFVPIRPDPTKQTEGVFAVETDVRPQLANLERAELIVFLGSASVLAALYLALLFIVRYADRTIKAQEQTIRERSYALEQLSAQLITAQEHETRRVAHELHEGIAQTLSGLKFRLEHANTLLANRKEADGQPLSPLISLVQEAIQDVRTLAMDIRPPSLDELGVVSTLAWYCRELQEVYVGLQLRFESELVEADVPKPLKVVLFRVVQHSLQFLVRDNKVTRIAVRLARVNGSVRLEVSDDLALDAQDRNEYNVHLVTLRERIALAGGSAETDYPNALHGTTLRAEWPL